MSSGLVSYGRVIQVIKQDREPLTAGSHQPNGSLRGEVVFRDVCFAYEANAPVLKDIRFECKPGQAIAPGTKPYCHPPGACPFPH